VSRFAIKIPFLQGENYCYELTIRQYKSILKSLFTDSLNKETLLNITNVICDITTLDIEQIHSLNFIEYFALLTFIRATSIGGTLPLVITDDNKKINIDVNLNNTIDNFLPLLTHEDTVIQEGDITFKVGLPTLDRLIHENNNSNLFIKQITLKNKTINNFNDIKAIVNVLTPRFINTVNTHCTTIQQKLQNVYFYKNINSKFNIPFIVTLDEILFLIKLLFGDNLINIYNDIFYLSKHVNISAEYLESCTPGEFKIFTKNLEEMLQINSDTITDNNGDEDINDI
jgi:hypothetical protein